MNDGGYFFPLVYIYIYFISVFICVVSNAERRRDVNRERERFARDYNVTKPALPRDKAHLSIKSDLSFQFFIYSLSSECYKVYTSFHSTTQKTNKIYASFCQIVMLWIEYVCKINS